MDFLELASKRFSVRDFKDTPIGQDKLDLILKAAQIAPSAKNNQAARIYVIRSEEGIARIRDLSRCAFNAPVVFMVGYDTRDVWHNSEESGIQSGPQDASIAACHMMLEAASLGIGTCWVNVFPNSLTASSFGLPSTFVPVLLMPAGYAASTAAPAPRHFETKNISELVTYL